MVLDALSNVKVSFSAQFFFNTTETVGVVSFAKFSFFPAQPIDYAFGIYDPVNLINAI